MLTTTGGMRGDSLEECKRVGDSWKFALAGGESEILRPFFYSTHWCFAVQDINARDSYIYLQVRIPCWYGVELGMH